MHRRYFTALFLPFLLCFVGGCGYQLVGGDAGLSPLKGKRTAVSMFENATYRPRLETILTETLRDEVSWRGHGTRSDADTADIVLSGRVTGYSSSPISYTADDRIREYRTTLTVEAVLKERATGAVLWKGSSVHFQDYPTVELPYNNAAVSERIAPPNRVALQQNNEDAAVREVCRKIAQDLLEKINATF